MSPVLWTALVGGALAGSHETYVGLSGGVHASVRQVGLGAGPQLGHRVTLGQRWTLGGSVTGLLLYDPALGVELEGGLQLRPEASRWRPWLGLELAGVFGTLRVERTDYDGVPSDPAVSARLAARPLTWASETLRWSLVEISAGPALEAPGRGLSLQLTPVVLGISW